MTHRGFHDGLLTPLRNITLAVPALDRAGRHVQFSCHRTDAAELLENAHARLDPADHKTHIHRTNDVRQSHFFVRSDFRTLSDMDAQGIRAALKRLGVTHDEIAHTIGRDRTVATKMLAGTRGVQVAELQPLRELIARHQRARGEADDLASDDYVEIEVLPTFAGMGGGGPGEGDRRVALVSRALVRDELRAQARDLLMIEVRGTSMEPLFRHGDQLLIDRRDRNPVQPGPFALFDGDSYLVKNVERAPGRRGWYRIWSANADFSEEAVEETETTIMGRPVWFARRL